MYKLCKALYKNQSICHFTIPLPPLCIFQCLSDWICFFYCSVRSVLFSRLKILSHPFPLFLQNQLWSVLPPYFFLILYQPNHLPFPTFPLNSALITTLTSLCFMSPCHSHTSILHLVPCLQNIPSLLQVYFHLLPTPTIDHNVTINIIVHRISCLT